MKKVKLFGMILCAAVLTGCGGEYAGVAEGDIVGAPTVSGEAVSGDAVRENAVSGPAVKDKGSRTEKTDMSSHRFCTDTNVYYEASENKIMQARVDGTHRKCIRQWSDNTGEEGNYVYVAYVDENWLYYEVTHYSDYSDETHEVFIYRAPITKDEAGQDVVCFQKAEELVKAEFLGSAYVDSDYYFYTDLRTSGVTQYDLKRKKVVSECKDVLGGDIFRIKDHYLCECNGEIYVKKADQAQWEKLSAFLNPQWNNYFAVQNDQAVFIAAYISDKVRDWRVNIKRCDEKAVTDFVTWEEMVRTVTEAAGVKELDVCGVEDYFWQGDRLYIQMQAGWIKEGHYHMEYMMISQGENEGSSSSGLRYEKELTECMKSHVKERKGKWFEDESYDEGIHMTVNDAQCIGMFDGKAYLGLYDYVKDQGRLGCYDLKTGKFEWIAKNSAAFFKYKLASSEESDEITDACEFADGEENPHTDIWSFPPSKVKEDVGEFREDK